MQINPAEFKLLVVDDVQTNVLLLKALLGKEGYGILVANNGQEALEVIRNENPDLILLDVMMPGMDGFEVAERLKSEEFRCEIPIIFLTALDDTQSIVNGFQTFPERRIDGQNKTPIVVGGCPADYRGKK